MLADPQGKTINLGKASALAAADWDRDGDVDLVAAFIGGGIVFLPNVTRDGVLAFGPHQVLQAGGQPIPSEHGGPAIGDWDLDGDLDLVVGSEDGRVVLYRASCPEKTGLPVLEPAVTLVEPYRGGAFRRDAEGRILNGRSASRAKPCIADWNGDGKPDLLVGDFASMRGPDPAHAERDAARKAALKRELKQLEEEIVRASARCDQEARRVTGIPETGSIPKDKVQAWSEAVRTLTDQDEEAVERKKRLGELRAELARMNTEWEMTGFVWLYRRR